MQASAESLKEQGNAAKAAGDLAGAEKLYRAAVAADAGYVPALYNLGLILEETGRAAESETWFRRASELDPADPDPLVQLGALLLARDDLGAAEPLLRRALELQPASVYAHFLLGRLLLGVERGAEAARHLEVALRADPAEAALQNDLGSAYRLAGRTQNAIACFEAALDLSPDLAEPRLNLGDLFVEHGDYPAAAAQYAEGLQRHPQRFPFLERLLFAQQQLCDWSRFEELSSRLLRELRARPEALTSAFGLLSIPTTAADQRRVADVVAARQAKRAPVVARRAAREGARLRIGYLSGDFREHVMGYLLADLFERHDRTAFEVHGYSYGPDDRSPRRARIEAALEHFTDIAGLGDQAAAERIAADGIDILVDLNGYTQHARTAILAARAAPVQVNYLGYPGTLGGKVADYIVLDPFLAGGLEAACLSEQPVLMPACYAPNDTTRHMAAIPSRAELGLPERAIVFCCFNQTFKILPEVFASWMRLLRAAPESVLWLLEGNRLANENLRREASRQGIEPGRLVFAPRMAPDRYLACLAAADLFLDTRPYGAHTTTADALWAGLPVVTQAGETFASRVAGSMLHTAGLPELVTGSPEEYESLALRLALAPPELGKLRRKTAAARASALFDMRAYASALETALRQMWKIHAAGEAPRPIKIGPPRAGDHS